MACPRQDIDATATTVSALPIVGPFSRMTGRTKVVGP